MVGVAGPGKRAGRALGLAPSRQERLGPAG